ncbi:ubiquitin carboxyl-terminal hydrolase 26 [Microtus ochrogaster]|uniref:Ubiquitin carboxyl-terminal hydrolase n=1 Tax=Microtus ochrogaster TaxID=79684 RepID=A0A8J6G821_MICOH|nr:ubiquitin carboxyl-terminal hydrolase 26 [Microtus ochrogaster]KAH0506460.1 Ubiquitin carboxyl-terminal hydrolase 26 [Microtus ochrogaster]
MDSQLIHAQIQMWCAKAGISKPRAAFIKTIMGKQEAKLQLCFSTGKIKALQLKNNIKSVVLRSYGKDQNYLNLTFKNNDFLFVENLTTIYARQLKKFLDRVHQRNLRAFRRNNKERSGGPSTSTQELGVSLRREVRAERNSKCFKSAKKSGAPVLDEMPLSSSSSTTPNSAGVSEKQLVKRKRSSRNSEKKATENIRQGSSKKSEAKSVVSVHDNKEKERDLREAEKSKPGFGFSSETNNPEESDLSVRNIHDLLTKLFSPFLLEPCSMAKDIEWHEYIKRLLLYPEKAWQGLPNVGNTCYINVVLQSLCAVPLFVNELFNQGFPWIRPPRDDFNMRLMQLLVLKDIYSAKARETLLINFTKVLPQFGEIFTAYRQNDAHEFLSLCLVQLKEAVQKLTVLWQAENESGRNNLLRQIFANHDIIDKIPFCPVANNFEFELMRSIFCKACGLVVHRKEPGNYLSISIPQGLKGLNLSIQSSFDLFFKAEELEHRCERCMHNRSMAVHKFVLLPRVIIIHLKRYIFTESQIMKKDEQHVIISKILKLSYHCNENTKPPQPISQNAHVKDFDLLKPLKELGSEILKESFHSMMTSGPKDSSTGNKSSNKESEAQNVRRVSKVLSGKVKQEDQGKGTTQNVSGSKLTKETKKHKKRKKACTSSELDSGSFSKATKDNDLRIPERSLKYQQVQKHQEQRNGKQTSREAVTQSHPKPSSQEQIGCFSKPAESHTQSGNVKLQGSLDSSKNLGSKDSSGKKTKLRGKVEPKTVEPKGDNYYRLINIISHIGSSPHGGHYINDAFDFRKKNWFTYNDPHVTKIQEELMQKARLSTGYVFFYMHNEIFEDLLAKEAQACKMS